MHPFRLGFLLAIATIPLACQRATRSPEQEQLLALHPSLAAKATDWASLPFSHASGPLPGDPAKSVVVTWGAVPGLARGQIAEVAVLGKGDEGPTVLSRVAAAAADWPGDGELASVEISPAVYALNARASAFAVRIVRRIRELQPMLSIESIALYQYDGNALRRLLGCVTGFSE